MAGSLIATTRTSEFQAFGTGGQLVIERADALIALLRRQLSPAHAALLAEPQADPVRGVVYWFAESDTPAIPLENLPEPDRSQMQAEFGRLSSDIRELAERLKNSANGSERFLGGMLSLTLHVPDESFVRVCGRQPVLVAWGHRRADETVASQLVTGTTSRALVPMAILPPPPLPSTIPRLWPWAAVLAAALVLLLAAIVFIARPEGWLVADAGACRISQGDLAVLAAYRQQEAREATLRSRLAALVSDAGRRRLACPAQPAAWVGPHGTTGTAETDIERARQRGAHSGMLQIVLAWDDISDIDLHVICPDGEELYFHNRSACGGVLDVDANGGSARTTTPVEHATWQHPPPGQYRVVVDPYKLREVSQSRFRLTIRQSDTPDRTLEGVALAGRRSETVTVVEVPQ